jgi:hypothetical protein
MGFYLKAKARIWPLPFYVPYSLDSRPSGAVEQLLLVWRARRERRERGERERQRERETRGSPSAQTVVAGVG